MSKQWLNFRNIYNCVVFLSSGEHSQILMHILAAKIDGASMPLFLFVIAQSPYWSKKDVYQADLPHPRFTE